jgi:predicted SnoaL-like aldol condensation-catalyzing enzyme
MGAGKHEATRTNKALIQELYQCLNRLDMERARHLVTDDYVDHSMNLQGLLGESALAALFALVRQNFPGFHIAVDDLIAEGDRVAVRWTIHTMSQAAPALAHLNGGITMQGISIYRLDHGRIAERWAALSM